MIKFLKGFLLILLNERGELAEGNEEAAEGAETNPAGEVSQGTEGEDQPETESPDYEKAFGEIEVNDDDTLNTLNGLGVVRDGNMVKFESIDDVRDLISKGNDYTVKTQEHSEAVKAFEAEMQTQRDAFEQEKAEYAQSSPEMEEVKFENDFFTNWVTQLQQDDPDLFQDFANSYNAATQQRNQIMSNPVLQSYEQKLAALEGKLGQFEESKFQNENKEILSGFDEGYQKELGAMAPRLASSGVFVNKGKVQEMWSANDNMSPRQAIFAVYGDALLKAESSSAKLAKTKLQSERRTGGENAEENAEKPAEGRNTLDAIKERWARKQVTS